MLKSRLFAKSISFTTATLMLISTFTSFTPEVSAQGTTVGTSGSISSEGATRGQAGGIAYLDSMAFRISLKEQPDYVNFTKSSDSNAEVLSKRFNYRYPDLPKDGIIFVPKDEYAKNRNYELGFYSSSSGKINKYKDVPDSKGRKKVVKYDESLQTKPKNKVKEKLTEYSSTNTRTKKSYDELRNGKWKKIFSGKKYTRADSVKYWGYVLKTKTKNTQSYSITTNLNELVSKDADMFRNYNQQKELFLRKNNSKFEDIRRGWIASLIHAWRIAPEGAKEKYERAIENVISGKKQDSTGKPVSLVIDTMTTIKWTNSPVRLIVPSSDYLQYYARTGSKYNLEDSKSDYVKGTDTTYEAFEKLVEKDMKNSPKKTRISDSFNANNVFSWGSAAVANKQKWFVTSNKNPRWVYDKVVDATMDVINIKQKAYGTAIASFTPVQDNLPLELRDKYKHSIDPPKPRKVGSDIATLRYKNRVDVKMALDLQEKEKWLSAISNNKSQNKYVTVKVDMKRSTEKINTGASIGGTNYIKSARGNWTKGVKLKLSDFEKLIKGQIVMSVIDDVSKAKISQGGKLDFSYTPTVSFSFNDIAERKTFSTKLKTVHAIYTRDKAPNVVDPDIKGTLTLTPAKQTLSKTQEKPTNNIKLTLKSSATTSMISKWEKLFKTYPKENANLVVTLKPTRNMDASANASESYDTGNAPSGKWTTGVTMSQAQFKNFLKGTTTISYSDLGIKNEVIKNAETKKVTYNTVLSVKYTNKGKEKTASDIQEKVAYLTREDNNAPSTGGGSGSGCTNEETSDSESDDGSSSCDTTTEELEPEPEPQPEVPDCTDCEEGTDTGVVDEEQIGSKMMFTSAQPTTFTEVKEGSRPLQEKFDAMSGVPSTKRLYYSVGGTEYLIDFEMEYMKDIDSVWRTYTSRFKGVDSKYRAGDTSGPKTVGGQSVDTHYGSSHIKTWQGSIPNKGVSKTVSGSGTVSATSTAVPDRSAYNSALKEAQAYQKEVANTEHFHTSVSDRVTRSYKGWSAQVNESPNDPKDVTVTKNFSHKESYSCGTAKEPKTCEKTVNDHGSVTANKGADGTFVISVTFSAPRAVLDGPDSFNFMPDVYDTWKQRVNYDYLKMTRINVYKLTNGLLTEANEVMDVGGDLAELKASITENDTSMIYNVAEENSIKNTGSTAYRESSRAGKIRYSLEKFQHDDVLWEEGVRSTDSDGMGCPSGGKWQPCNGGHANFWSEGILYNNSEYPTDKDHHKKMVGTKGSYSSNTVDAKDVATKEWKQFDYRRNLDVTATIIPDNLILRTSAGDRVAMYFEKNSKTVKAQEQFPDVRISKAEMWDNNPNSAVLWDNNQIGTGSYNGRYNNVTQKYEPYNVKSKRILGVNGTISTAYDDNGSGWLMQRPVRGYNGKMKLYASRPIDITKPNDEYNLGDSYAFYKELVNFESPSPYEQYDGGIAPETNMFQADDSDYFTSEGLGFDVNPNYSDSMSGVNNVIIHTPVSTQNAMIIAEPKENDQRIDNPEGGAKDLINQNNVNDSASDGDEPEFDYTPYKKIHTKTTTVTRTGTKTTIIQDNNSVNGNYGYTGEPKTVDITADGEYQFELYGASGGGNTTYNNPVGGKGGYVKATVPLKKGDKVYIYVGGQGETVTRGIDQEQNYVAKGGYNGGGNGSGSAGSGGGGASDIRLNGTAIGDRILVAGGGGGNGRDSNYQQSKGGQTSIAGYQLYQGRDGINGNTGTYPFDHSGGGGGYYGGDIETGEDSRLGYGGTNYVTPNAKEVMTDIGSNTGHGSVSIKSSKIVTEKDEVSSPEELVVEDDSEDGEYDSYKGWLWKDLFGVADWKKYFDEKVTTSTQETKTIYDYIYKDGVLVQTITILDENAPITNNGGSTTGSTVVKRVITEEKQEVTETNLVLNQSKMMNDINTFPDYMVDGTFNPIKKDKGVKQPQKPSPIETPVNTPSGNIRLGTFINLDHTFQMYFPNTGDFAQQPNLHGINTTTQVRGLGYYNDMDLLEYTKAKRVKFPFSVIYNNVTYTPDTWIELIVNQDYYTFYIPLSNVEMSGAEIQWESIPVNGQPYEEPVNDNSVSVTNKDRFSTLDSYHGALKKSYIDVVGRIGNLMVTDTEDVGFRPMFKKSICEDNCKPKDWMLPDLAKRVQEDKQISIYGDRRDIHNDPLKSVSDLDTWGTQTWINGVTRRTLPIKALDNPIKELQETQMRLGYNLTNEVTTIGNYQNGALRVLPYYYKLDLSTGEIIPLDVYKEEQGVYKLLNRYKGADDDKMPEDIYDLRVVLDWEKEYKRRNYTLLESEITRKTSEVMGENIYDLMKPPTEYDENGNKVPNILGVVGTQEMTVPKGEYTSLGNYQRVVGDKTARTFVGTEYTHGQYKNPDKFADGQDKTDPEFNPKGSKTEEFNYGAQRWHLKIGLPTGSEFVKHGDAPTLKNRKAIKETDGVVLLAADISSIGNLYTLRHDQMGESVIPIKRDGVTKNYDISKSGIPNVLAVYEMDYDVVEDLRTRNSH